MKIVGKQKVDYVSKKTGEQVTGVTLHCVGTNARVEGECVETIFISGKSGLFPEVSKMPVGKEISVSYNRYGSVESVHAC